MMINGCNQSHEMPKGMERDTGSFSYFVEQFADLKILRYKVPGFELLSLEQKEFLYCLSNAALCGRDILFDQFYVHNLSVRRTLEAIVKNHKNTNNEKFDKFMIYTKRIWFSNGIHHHYSTDKIIPDFSEAYFTNLLKNTPEKDLPLKKNETKPEFISRITKIIFDPTFDPKRVNQDVEKGLVAGSACNFYQDGITSKAVERFYDNIKPEKENKPVEYGLNSKLVAENGKISEKTWFLDGMYGPAIEKIIFWLEKATEVAENKQQKKNLELLIDYYKTGNLATWDEYNINWVSDTSSFIDFVNGFVEVYGDPLGIKATWESVVNFKDEEATKRTRTISKNAQWFEDHSPIDEKFKKETVTGVSAKVIKVVQLGGDCYPSTPVGINLPNSAWIRKEHGSKSVTISNIIHAYHQVSLQEGFSEEFSYDSNEIELYKKYGALATDLHVDLHECLGHGSGQLLPGVDPNALLHYSSVIEEARADLFALYFVMDDKMIELGLVPSKKVAITEYNSYIRNGLLTQLIRIQPGKDIEQAHMRNRQLIAGWCFDKGQKEKVIEKIKKNGKTYIKINDYEKLRLLFANLLKEIQRIKSEGDFDAARALVEKYGVKVDKTLHNEILERYEKLQLAPYSGFLNPLIKPVKENEKTVDYQLDYSQTYQEQMMYYSDQFSFLPDYN